MATVTNEIKLPTVGALRVETHPAEDVAATAAAEATATMLQELARVHATIKCNDVRTGFGQTGCSTHRYQPEGIRYDGKHNE
ncbi:MAG: hypothetical protein ABI164_07200 [Acidobacteriaceae bacterium]